MNTKFSGTLYKCLGASKIVKKINKFSSFHAVSFKRLTKGMIKRDRIKNALTLEGIWQPWRSLQRINNSALPLVIFTLVVFTFKSVSLVLIKSIHVHHQKKLQRAPKKYFQKNTLNID